MSYTKQTWVSGDIITADKMNHIESGVYTISEKNDKNTTDIETIKGNITTMTNVVNGVALQITTLEKTITLEANAYCQPYTHLGTYSISEDDINTYGEVVSVCAVNGAGVPLPARFNTLRRYCTVTGTYAEAYLYVTFVKIVNDYTEEESVSE